MKKFVLPLFSGLFVLSLVLGTFVTAKAAPGDDPTVTPVSGDIDFTTEVVAIASLPGVVELVGGMLAPVGFPDGEAQFGGDGVRVTGMEQGKATACFYLATSEINQGWGGKVGVWDGAKWSLLATTITAQEDTNNTVACAPVTGSGTYAFIKYVTDPDKLPVAPVITKDPCASWSIGLGGANPWSFLSGRLYGYPDSIITYKIINYTEPFFGDLSGVTMSDSTSWFSFGDNEWSSSTHTPSPAFTIHIETPGCYYDWEFAEGDFTSLW